MLSSFSRQESSKWRQVYASHLLQTIKCTLSSQSKIRALEWHHRRCKSVSAISISQAIQEVSRWIPTELGLAFRFASKFAIIYKEVSKSNPLRTKAPSLCSLCECSMLPKLSLTIHKLRLKNRRNRLNHMNQAKEMKLVAGKLKRESQLRMLHKLMETWVRSKRQQNSCVIWATKSFSKDSSLTCRVTWCWQQSLYIKA